MERQAYLDIQGPCRRIVVSIKDKFFKLVSH
jgi:hypothetical protein